MSDVEKYGLVAVVFVGGLLLVIATQGGFGGKDAKALAPEVIDAATPMRSTAAAPGAKPGGDNTVRVVSVLPDTPFHWSEPPVPYPGRRSAGQPVGSAAAGNDDSSESLNTTPLSAPVPASGSAALAAAATSHAAPASAGTHVIAKGETLEDVAEKYLGAKSKWKDLVALNPGLDPKRLKIGQVVRVSAAQPGAALALSPNPNAFGATPQSAPSSAPSPLAKPVPSTSTPAAALGNATKSRTHTVVKGDTLGKIAKQYLGSSSRADDIYKANTDVLKSKDALAVGQVLRIP